MELIRLENVTKTYDKGEPVTPIQNLNMVVETGSFIIISGESGIGKSTLLMMIGALIAPTSGDIFYKGDSLNKMSEAEKSRLRGDHIGYIFQQPQFVQALTVEENLKLAAKTSDQDLTPAKAMDLLGLSNCRNNLPHQLSGGQKRRLAFAIAFLRDPEILLADEPTNDLDEAWSEKIIQLLKERTADSRTVIMVTHSKKWDDLADLHYIIENGDLVSYDQKSI